MTTTEEYNEEEFRIRYPLTTHVIDMGLMLCE